MYQLYKELLVLVNVYMCDRLIASYILKILNVRQVEENDTFSSWYINISLVYVVAMYVPQNSGQGLRVSSQWYFEGTCNFNYSNRFTKVSLATSVLPHQTNIYICSYVHS